MIAKCGAIYDVPATQYHTRTHSFAARPTHCGVYVYYAVQPSQSYRLILANIENVSSLPLHSDEDTPGPTAPCLRAEPNFPCHRASGDNRRRYYQRDTEPVWSCALLLSVALACSAHESVHCRIFGVRQFYWLTPLIEIERVDSLI